MLDINLNKAFADFKLDASFAADGVGVTALFGHSGSGKSSIINMIAGLLKPDAGRVVVNERCVFDAGKGIDVPPEERRFAYVFQEDRLFPHLTVRSNLAYGMKRTALARRYARFDAVVELLGISGLLGRYPATLSGGEKQRVSIGRALLASPELLLMDEPLASLDAARKAELEPFIARLPREFSVPILYVSHSVDEILNLADVLVFISQGLVVDVGSVEDVASRPEFQRLTGRAEAGVVLSTTVESHNPEDGITKLRFAGGLLCIQLADVPLGSAVRVRIHPRNVGIALCAVPGTSIQNIFEAAVDAVSDASRGAPVDVRMNIAGAPLIATVTPKAARELDLKPGKNVFAMIKSVSISLGNALDRDSRMPRKSS